MEEKNNNTLSHLVTADGSSTLLNKAFNATYHSTKGALGESNYVFIEHGLRYFFSKFMRGARILEYGFGTGLNALLSIEEAVKSGYFIEYWGLEHQPLPEEVYSQLFVGKAQNHKLLNELHTCSWDELHTFSNVVQFRKCKLDFSDFSTALKFDIIYYDAFAPGIQPELWTLRMMEKVLSNLSENGFLVTYCANGAFKRNLKQAGYRVETLPGPPGKREMTRIWLK